MPKVAPGEYTVYLQIGDFIFNKDFKYTINPELEESGTSVSDLIE